MEVIMVIITLVVAAGAYFAGNKLNKKDSGSILKQAEELAGKVLDDARREADTITKEAQLKAKDAAIQAKEEHERKTSEKNMDLQALEKRLAQKEENHDKKSALIDQKEMDVLKKEQAVSQKGQALDQRDEELKKAAGVQNARLEQISGMSAGEAKKELMNAMETEAKHDAAKIIRAIEDEARETGDKKAKEIMALAIQRYAGEYVAERTVSVVPLPNDEMKGRIIGREGRNIRALELATGVDLIVDDTPEAVILSGFDPIRREVARISLERLMQDGRIHPARIEEIVEKVRLELDQKLFEEGEAAAFSLGITDIHPEILKLLGRLRYRTSYGQNVLVHSLEVAQLAALMALELGVNQEIAKRGGLLHDIGKSIDREMEGTHLELGRQVLEKYGERREIIHAMECHHGDYDPTTVEAVLVNAADALSAARPGARREILENYVHRLERLESIADNFEGVTKAFAIQAGRELRIIVNAEKLSDEQSIWLSKDVARRIESELQYPGQIKVTVIRETRAVDFAK